MFSVSFCYAMKHSALNLPLALNLKLVSSVCLPQLCSGWWGLPIFARPGQRPVHSHHGGERSRQDRWVNTSKTNPSHKPVWLRERARSPMASVWSALSKDLADHSQSSEQVCDDGRSTCSFSRKGRTRQELCLVFSQSYFEHVLLWGVILGKVCTWNNVFCVLKLCVCANTQAQFDHTETKEKPSKCFPTVLIF